MRKQRLSRRIAKGRGIERLFVIGCCRHGTRAPADDPVRILLGGPLLGAETGEQIAASISLEREIEVDAGRLGRKGDETSASSMRK